MPDVDVGPLAELPPGTVKIVREGDLGVGVFNAGGELYAIEDRCSHDDGPLCEGDFEPGTGVVTCPRHGARFDIRTGRPLSLPAVLPVDTFPVRIEGDRVFVELGAAEEAA